MGTEAHEEWIEARMLEYQSLPGSGHALPPEEFAAGATADEPLRALLLQRLRVLRRLEGGFALLREEAMGPGTELADFEILEELGSGGMGRVFRARQRSVARSVAIKVPHRSAALEPGARLRLLREAQAVAQLRHPSVVPLLQVGEHEGAPFLVFELSEGRSLAKVVADLVHGRVPRSGESLGRPGEPYPRAAVQVLVSALEGLSAAHEAGIVHRDVKPDNVLLEEDGRVRVVDFGLARRIDQDTLTESRELIGTVGYMAPELVRSPHAAGPWSDVWSAGVVLYELLALRRPFEGETTLQILRRIEGSELVPLHVSHGVPKPLSAIVEKALSREISGRYPSARELLADLRAFLEGREVRARPSTVLTRLGRRLGRHPGLTAAGVALALLLALLAGVWRSRGEVRAEVRLARAEDVTREALLWWYADAGAGGRPTTTTTGRRLAIAKLEDALREAPHLVEARVQLAQYLAMATEGERALELVDGLEAEGLRLRCLAWTRAFVRDPSRQRVRPDPGETLDLATVADLDRLAWARHLRQESEMEQAMEVVRPIATHPILGPAATYAQFEACSTRQRRDPVLALAFLEATLATSPEHPVALANLAHVLGILWQEAASQPNPSNLDLQARSNLAAEMEALLPRLVQAESTSPWFSTLWSNHVVVLGLLGRHDEAAAIARAGLEHHRGDGGLTDNLAQTYLIRWTSLQERGEPIPPAELEELRARLELAVETDAYWPENLLTLTYVHYRRDDFAATSEWGERARTQYLALEPQDLAKTRTHRELLDEMMAWAAEAAETE